MSEERYQPRPAAPASGGGSGGKIDLKDILAILAGVGVAVPMLKYKFGGAKDQEPDIGAEADKEIGSLDTPDVQMMAEGGVVEAGEDRDESDPMELPEDIREYVENAHKERRESRPDESWRITPAKKEESIAPYKRDEEETADKTSDTEGLMAMGMPHYDEGGVIPGAEPESRIITFLRNLAMSHDGDAASDRSEVQQAMNVDKSSDTVKNYSDGGITPENFDPGAVLQDLAPAGVGTLTPSPAKDDPLPPIASAPPPGITPPPAAPAMATPETPPPARAQPPTDADFMGRANKMLGLNPEQQVAFLRMLGQKSQKSQIGAAIAGIGDAIASGGTLGKVNPGALARSEDIIQGNTKEGVENMQTLRGNNEKTTELSQKLQAQDPNSPLSKYAQKAYAGIGKKLGLDLSHASASLIGDVSGKGVEALNTEYQNQLKIMGLDLQKKQVEATIGNQKAERDIAREGHQAEAAKTLSDKGIIKTVMDAIPGTTGHAATEVLKRQALGDTATPAPSGPVKVNSAQEYKALPSGTHYVDSFGTEKVKK